MTEQEIERCLERLSSCKTADVINFDYAGTHAYIKRLQEENAALRERLEKAVELPARVMIERTIVNGKFKPTQKAQAFNGRIGVVYRDETRYKGLLVDICSEKVSD